MIGVSKLETIPYEEHENQRYFKSSDLGVRCDMMTAANGKLMFTDYTSTLHRIEKVLKEIDRK